MNATEFVVSAPPHIHSVYSVRRLMLGLFASLLPVLAAAFWAFGLDALRVAGIALVSAAVWELLLQRVFGKPFSLTDGSAFAYGLLFAMLLPATAPWWLIAVGTLLLLLLGKHLYGGLGCNPFNGILIAYAALMLSYPGLMQDFPAPTAEDIMTESPPLVELKDKGPEDAAEAFPLAELFFGSHKVTGALGEVSPLAVLVGGIFLIATRTIPWVVPAAFLAGLTALAGLFRVLDPETYASPVFHLLAGGAFLAAFMIAPDWPTSPVTRPGRIVYGLIGGALAFAIRAWSQWPEGAYFGVFLASLATPLLDRLRPTVFGARFTRRRPVRHRPTGV
ncbi:MAG: RnfABCDGE type electron transport complex subunit D [Desulfobacterales bacterium]